MNTYKQFHGNMLISQIEKEILRLIKIEGKSFKIVTGYGSKKGSSRSKDEAIKVLTKLQSKNVIKGFLPGEVKRLLLYTDSPYYENKLKFDTIIKNDLDYGNEGIIFIFL